MDFTKYYNSCEQMFNEWSHNVSFKEPNELKYIRWKASLSPQCFNALPSFFSGDPSSCSVVYLNFCPKSCDMSEYMHGGKLEELCKIMDTLR